VLVDQHLQVGAPNFFNSSHPGDSTVHGGKRKFPNGSCVTFPIGE
jgi:hypothetical protein